MNALVRIVHAALRAGNLLRDVLFDLDNTLGFLWPTPGWTYEPRSHQQQLSEILHLLETSGLRAFLVSGRPVGQLGVLQFWMGGKFACGEFGSAAWAVELNAPLLHPRFESFVREAREEVLAALRGRLAGLPGRTVIQPGRCCTVCLYPESYEELPIERIEDCARAVVAEFAGVVELKPGELGCDILPSGARKEVLFEPEPALGGRSFFDYLYERFHGEPFDFARAALFEDSDAGLIRDVAGRGGLVCTPTNAENGEVQRLVRSLGGVVGCGPGGAGTLECLRAICVGDLPE